jgi:error-prone DNA polymerase
VVLRLGMRLVKGLSRDHAERLAAYRTSRGPARSVMALWREAGVPAPALRRLAAADAFGSMNLSRQAALWAVQPLRDEPLPLFDAALARERTTEPGYLPRPSGFAEVSLDYAASGLSLRPHPLSFVRDELAAMGAVPAGWLADADAAPDGARLSVAGLVLVRQRPETASGVTFMTIEDESGSANVVVWPAVYERCRAAVRHAGVVLCTGRVQREGRVVHLIARTVRRLDLSGFKGVTSRDFH